MNYMPQKRNEKVETTGFVEKITDLSSSILNGFRSIENFLRE
jgi:hypothetical protein